MTRKALTSLLLLCLISLGATPVLAQQTGTISGQVRNGTAGGDTPPGMEVVLRVFQDQTEQEPLTTTADAQGWFRFENLEVGSNWVYLLRVSYEDVIYSSGMLSFEPDQSELTPEIVIYETSTANDAINVGRAHIFIDASETSLSVTELYVFVNPTDRTYTGSQEIGGRRWTSRFILPQGSRDLTLSDGELGGRFLSTEDGFVDTEPQWPGSTSVLFNYTVDCPAGSCDLARQITHPVTDLNVLVAESGVQVESDVLALAGTQQAEGQSYLNYVAHNLVPGQRLNLSVRLVPDAPAAASPTRGSTQVLPWIILGTVIAALVLVYPFWRQRIQASAREDK
jgi:hypothetical protein